MGNQSQVPTARERQYASLIHSSIMGPGPQAEVYIALVAEPPTFLFGGASSAPRSSVSRSRGSWTRSASSRIVKGCRSSDDCVWASAIWVWSSVSKFADTSLQ